MEAFVTRLGARLAPHGLNLVGVTPAAAYDVAIAGHPTLRPLASDVRTVVVIGNGGTGFWEAFRRRAEHDPAAARSPHPLDAFTQVVVRDALAPLPGELPVAARIVYPFEAGPDALSFMHLAECAGLGRPSLLGVLVHPEFGPWMALRAALLLPSILTAPRPADGFDPCPTCVERPCIAACPGGAVGAAGWDVPRCIAHRLSGPGDGCDAGCHARIACVLGRPHRYPAAALAFHQGSARATFVAAADGSAEPDPARPSSAKRP